MSQKNANDLYTIFTTGKILTSSQNYDEAVECFHYVNDQFKSRENFNNAGVALLLQALNSKTKNFKEFIYPIELDPVSRLNSSTTRGATEITNYRRLLALAKKEFKFAYNLDDSYTEALINLAYVSLLEGNPLVAVQEYIPLIIPDDTVKYANKINLVKAIAYFETDTLKSATYFNMIFSGKDSIMDYDRTLFTLRNDRGGNLLNNYKNEWGKRNAIPQPTEEQLRTFNKGNLQKSRNIYPDLHSDDMEKITIAASDDKNLIRVLLNDKELLTAIRYNDSNEWIIQPKEAGLKVNNSTLKKPMVIKL